MGSTVGLLTVMLLGGPFGSAAQEPVQLRAEKTGDTLCRLGFITVDTARRVATIPATVNDTVMGGPLTAARSGGTQIVSDTHHA